jgi:hypothetical protein
MLATLPAMLDAERELWRLSDKRDPNILVLILGRKYM